MAVCVNALSRANLISTEMKNLIKLEIERVNALSRANLISTVDNLFLARRQEYVSMP